ncbi:MAG: hypothetical protein AB1414_03875 [bacterium]
MVKIPLFCSDVTVHRRGTKTQRKKLKFMDDMLNPIPDFHQGKLLIFIRASF